MLQLAHTSLDENVRYEALSYTWGGNIGTDSIALNDIAFPVTRNLFVALRALRSEDCAGVEHQGFAPAEE